QLDSTIIELVKKNEERKKVYDAFRAKSGTIMIEQVDIDGYKRSPMSKSIIERAGEPDVVLDGKELQEKEEDWSYGLYNVLTFNSKNLIDILQDSSFNYYATVSGSDITLVLVDGDYDRLNQDLIATIPTSEVRSVDIINCADNFRTIYMEKTGSLLDKLIFCGSIININTYRGKGILDARDKPIGINKFIIPVFSTPKEYYSPSYKKLKPDNSNKPDLRALVYWQPDLSTNKQGIALTSFFNADNVGNMKVVVEAISKEGKIGYKEMEYTVEGEKTNIIIIE
ncbi:MAG TPA: hypothetical protein PLK12_16810, partial [Prolixibacteraceae bacterium]|nr:hypothetical protein [Prolixibacteraceae bacterium]